MENFQTTIVFEFSYDGLAIVTSLSAGFQVEFEVNSDNEDFSPESNFFNLTVHPQIHSKLHISRYYCTAELIIISNGHT